MAKLMVLIALVILSLVGLAYGSGYGYAGAYPVIVGGGGFGGGYTGGGGIGGILQFIFPLIILAVILPIIKNLGSNNNPVN